MSGKRIEAGKGEERGGGGRCGGRCGECGEVSIILREPEWTENILCPREQHLV